MLQATIESIKSVIRDENQFYKKECLGVIAVIVFGSFAKKEFHLHSDLDVCLVTDTNKTHIQSPSLKLNYVDYINRFIKSLSQRLEGRKINLFQEAVPKSKIASSGIGIKGFNDKYIIVTPYQNIQTFIQNILHNKKR